MKVLFTSGGTREYLDAARFITNMSTGRTGRILAGTFAARGCKTVCLCAQGGERPAGRNIEVREFITFKDLDKELRRVLKEQSFDAIVHLAAVSDYSPVLIRAGGRKFRPGRKNKLGSDAPEITVVLKRNFKILDHLKNYAAAGKGAAPLLAGFKLTAGAGAAAALKKVRALAAADLVVHNDLAEMRKKHVFHVYAAGRRLADCAGPEKLAAWLYAAVEKYTEAKCS